MKFHTSATVGIACGAALLAVPASAGATHRAQAITASPFMPCYQAIPPNGAKIPVSLTGGTPGDNYLVAATYPGSGTGSAGSADSTAPFTAAGTGSVTLTDISPKDAIDPTPGVPIDLSVEDFNTNTGTTTTPLGTITVTNLALAVSSRPSNPRRARQVKVSAIAFADKPIYGFVTNRRGTQVLRRFPLGRANVCGYTARKAIVTPKHYRFGSYRLYINAGPKLNKPYSLSEGFSITRI